MRQTLSRTLAINLGLTLAGSKAVTEMRSLATVLAVYAESSSSPWNVETQNCLLLDGFTTTSWLKREHIFGMIRATYKRKRKSLFNCCGERTVAFTAHYKFAFILRFPEIWLTLAHKRLRLEYEFWPSVTVIASEFTRRSLTSSQTTLPHVWKWARSEKGRPKFGEYLRNETRYTVWIKKVSL